MGTIVDNLSKEESKILDILLTKISRKDKTFVRNFYGYTAFGIYTENRKRLKRKKGKN